MASNLSSLLEIKATKDLGLYLGFPALHNRSSGETYSQIVDKVRKILSGWKSNSLSFAGRATLTQSCLYNIPNYILQAVVIPCFVCEEIERLCKIFIWVTTQARKRCHLISWDKICRPKEFGGLGFRPLRVSNEAYMIKLAWNIIARPDSFWVKVLREKYGLGVSSMPSVKTRNKASSL
ncbi:ribonuclease H [Sesbania bispinosa]|nr:ribonuclease H [Sesbania bispinosa]